MDGVELSSDNSFSSTLPHQPLGNQDAAPSEGKLLGDVCLPVVASLDGVLKEAEKGQSTEKDGVKVEQGEADRLFVHLRDNMETIRKFCKDTVHQIPIPDQCVMEGNVNMMDVHVFSGTVRTMVKLMFVPFVL